MDYIEIEKYSIDNFHHMLSLILCDLNLIIGDSVNRPMYSLNSSTPTTHGLTITLYHTLQDATYGNGRDDDPIFASTMLCVSQVFSLPFVC